MYKFNRTGQDSMYDTMEKKTTIIAKTTHQTPETNYTQYSYVIECMRSCEL